MNWTKQIYEAMQEFPSKMALWTAQSGPCSFAELSAICRRTQAYLHGLGLQRGDSVLLLDLPGPRLYAAILAVNAMGANVMFVEPWMPIARINHVIDMVKPKIFWSPLIGQIWALRLSGIRGIKHWVKPKIIDTLRDPKEVHFEEMSASDLAILTFTSGTSGQPKGIPRSHHYLKEVNALFRTYDTEVDTKPDLAVFPNAVLYQLGRARGSLLVPPNWNMRTLKKIARLPDEWQPHTVSCGPAFLKRLISVDGFPRLRWLGVGGALIDAKLMEDAFRRFPAVECNVIYGSTEVEPVAHSDGRVAVQKSRDAGFYQLLYLGQPMPDITLSTEKDGLWVSGPHVSPEYLTASDEDKRLKRRDPEGRLWHAMGDRIRVEADGLWYQGRSFQNPEDFAVEQKIYSLLQHSSCFVARSKRGDAYLLGEGITKHAHTIKQICPELKAILETKIVRDRRHRSRIDRQASRGKYKKLLDQS